MSRDIAALVALIEARSGTAHSWRRGEDCVSFAAACVKAQTGIDLLDDVPGWATRAEALRVARTLGGLSNLLDTRLTRIAPAFARRGDIAGLPDRKFGVRLMVVEGATLIGPGETGLERLPRAAMKRAWSLDAIGGAADE